MKNTLKLFTLFILLTLLFVPTTAAYAQGPNPGDGGRVIFGSNYTVESGDTFNGDLVVFGGNVTIEENANLNGNLVVIGGTVKSNGETKGDVVVVGGQVSLEKAALVTGDLVTIGGQLEQAEGAKVEGQIVNNAAPNITLPARIPPTAPTAPDVQPPHINIDYHPFAQMFGIISWAVVISAFSMLISLFWQPQLERAGKTIVSQPLMAGAIGLLSFVGAVALFFTVLPLLVGIPLAWLFGVVAMGSEVGQRFTKAINQVWSPVLTIGFGTFLVMLVGGAIGSIPCIGGLLLFVLGLLAVGGSVLIWFGARQVQVPAVTVYTPPADSGQIPPAA
ncbi:MAG TPA: hypothetical protein VK249_31700 [Anaerolineales bacterium]|nr:hypothetical protein [Anaerolineales bacterium]